MKQWVLIILPTLMMILYFSPLSAKNPQVSDNKLSPSLQHRNEECRKVYQYLLGRWQGKNTIRIFYPDFTWEDSVGYFEGAIVRKGFYALDPKGVYLRTFDTVQFAQGELKNFSWIKIGVEFDGIKFPPPVYKEVMLINSQEDISTEYRRSFDPVLIQNTCFQDYEKHQEICDQVYRAIIGRWVSKSDSITFNPDNTWFIEGSWFPEKGAFSVTPEGVFMRQFGSVHWRERNQKPDYTDQQTTLGSRYLQFQDSVLVENASGSKKEYKKVKK